MDKTDPLKEAKEILLDLENELTARESTTHGLRKLNPGWEEVSQENWIETRDRCWLHGATKIVEANELERWLFVSPPLTTTAQIPATKIRRTWRKWLETKGPSENNFGPRGAFYVDNPRFRIPASKKGELLIYFIIRLAKLEKGVSHPLEWRAMNSFLDFIRKTYPAEEVAFIEQIIPQKKDLYFGKIRRLLSPEAYPIPEATASEIIIEFARRCRIGRPDAQLTAAEGLGLCILCLAASRLRLPIHLETLHKISPTAIQSGIDLPILQVPTWFGNLPVNISHRWAKFLKVLTLIPSNVPRETILQRPLRTLNRTFEDVLKNISPKPEYGNITFTSLLRPPTSGEYRYQPKALENN